MCRKTLVPPPREGRGRKGGKSQSSWAESQVLIPFLARFGSFNLPHPDPLPEGEEEGGVPMLYASGLP